MSDLTFAEPRDAGRATLTETESKAFLSAAELPVVRTRFAGSREEALRVAVEIGFPLAMKILSPDIIHKSDGGGVRLNIATAVEAADAYDHILQKARSHHPEAHIEGVSVQRMAPLGQEVIIGMAKDAQFGPLLMFGAGGTLVELLKDVSFRIVPLSPRDAREMIAEIKSYPLLTGFRGTEPADLASLEKLLVQVSKLVEDHPEIKELDLNPVIAHREGVLIVDARIVLEAER
jgi:acyl-CoA synthetase (NDP forming)